MRTEMWLALIAFWTVLETPPPALQARLQEAVAAIERDDLATAKQTLEQVVGSAPSNGTAWFLLAQVHARQKNAAGAFAAAEKTGQFAGRDSALLYNLAVLYRDLGRVDLAVGAVKRSLAIEDSADGRTLLGKSLVQKKQFKEAIPEFERARKLSPDSEQAVFNLAQAHLQMRDFPGGIAVLEEGRKSFDKSAQIELALGVAYYGQRRFKDAVDQFLRVIDLDPGVPQPYYFIGRVLEHATDRIPEVLVKAMNFEKMNPRSPIGYVLHAKALILQLPPGEYPTEAQTAHDSLVKALAIKEDQAEAHYLMGVLLERKQEYVAAAAQLERSIMLNEKDPTPHFRLARVYDRLGRKEDAARERSLHEKLSADGPRNER